jgi:hypothetical protein
MVQLLHPSNRRGARTGKWVTIGLAVASLATAVWAYPNYLPFLNELSIGRPGYILVNDSNLDWNHALPEVESFARQRGLNQILLDEYGFSEPTAYAPQAQLWSCQEPSPSDGGQWAVVSAGNIADGIAFGSCSIRIKSWPAAACTPFSFPQCSPGWHVRRSPLPKAYRYFGGFPGFDPRPMFLNCIRDPQQLQPTMDRMQAMMEAAAQKKK